MPLVAYHASNNYCHRAQIFWCRERGAGKRNPGDYFVEAVSMVAIALITRFSMPASCQRTPVRRKILKPTPKILDVYQDSDLPFKML